MQPGNIHGFRFFFRNSHGSNCKIFKAVSIDLCVVFVRFLFLAHWSCSLQKQHFYKRCPWIGHFVAPHCSKKSVTCHMTRGRVQIEFFTKCPDELPAGGVAVVSIYTANFIFSETIFLLFASVTDCLVAIFYRIHRIYQVKQRTQRIYCCNFLIQINKIEILSYENNEIPLSKILNKYDT